MVSFKIFNKSIHIFQIKDGSLSLFYLYISIKGIFCCFMAIFFISANNKCLLFLRIYADIHLYIITILKIKYLVYRIYNFRTLIKCLYNWINHYYLYDLRIDTVLGTKLYVHIFSFFSSFQQKLTSSKIIIFFICLIMLVCTRQQSDQRTNIVNSQYSHDYIFLQFAIF